MGDSAMQNLVIQSYIGNRQVHQTSLYVPSKCAVCGKIKNNMETSIPKERP